VPQRAAFALLAALAAAPCLAQTPTLAIADKTVTEGNTGSLAAGFVVTLSAAAASTVTVAFTTVDGTAKAATDYTATSGILSFAPGVRTLTIGVPVIGDTVVEPDETFRVTLSTPTGATLADAQAVGTIVNTDRPAISIADRSLNEPAATADALFAVTLSAVHNMPVTVNYTTVDGPAKAGTDYVATAGTLTFAPGQRTQNIVVPVNGDALVEADETFRVNLSVPTNATIADASATGTIVDNDKPAFTIADRTVTETDTGTIAMNFTVSLSSAPFKTVTVHWATADGSAKAPADYTAASGNLSFAPGQRTKTVAVNAKGENLVEGDETFRVVLSTPVNASMADASATGTILSDDHPAISIDDVTVTEGNTGRVNAVFTLRLTPAAASAGKIHWAAGNGTASLGNLDFEAASGDWSFGAGATTKTVSVPVNGDLFVETDETFFVTLSAPQKLTIADNKGQGTIRNDDTVAVPTIAISNVSVQEGDSGTSAAAFNVTLSAPGTATIAVSWATANGTGTAGSDYTAAAGRVSFPAGITSRSVSILVSGDAAAEPDEDFFVNLSNATNATIRDRQGRALISNDDTAPPPAPVAMSPTGDVATRTPELRWNAAAGAVDYYVFVGRPSGSPVVQQWLTGATACVAAACAFTPAAALGDGDFRFWVKARNSAGTSPASNALSFSVRMGAEAITVTSHDEGQAVSERGFLVSGRVGSAVTALRATLDDSLLGRTIDRAVEFAPGSRRFTLWVRATEVSAGELAQVTFTTEGDVATRSLGLNVVADDRRAEQLARRAGFGATRDSLAQAAAMGYDAFLAEQLNPLALDDTALEARLLGVSRTTKEGLQTHALLRAAFSRRQLQELLTTFWDNHFNTDLNKHAVVAYESAENDLFRQNALGRFRDLLAVSSASPAMLVYLDNNLSVRGAPNENYARELMELHTLGVDGGYTQQDVVMVARAFTGWQVQGGAFAFNSADHDTTQKLVLGQTLASGRGIEDGWDVLDILAQHPSTARFICTKLARLLVHDAPSTTLVDGCADTFLATDGQIAQVVAYLTGSPDFAAGASFAGKVKDPQELVVSMVRNLEATTAGSDLVAPIRDMGLRLFENPVPTGWSETGDDWVSSNTLLERLKWVNRTAYAGVGSPTRIDPLAYFRAAGYETAEGIVGHLFEVSLGREASDEERAVALEMLAAAGAPFDIDAPEADARLRRLVGTVLSYPEYQFQ